jgi:tripartite-type tricarboxylate transporter receptor subunit TctC
MRKFRRQTRAVIFAAVACSMTLQAATPQAQTSSTIKIIVPYPPGGAADILARLLVEQVGRMQGKTAIVENRPGAGTVIGTEAVSRSIPDGTTLLFNTNPFVITPHLRRLNYDPLTSFEPICYLVSSPMVIVVNSASPYRTLADLTDAARARPGDLTMASVGPAGVFQIAVEMLKRATNVDLAYWSAPLE